MSAENPTAEESETSLEGCPTLREGTESLEAVQNRLDRQTMEQELTLLSVVGDDTKYTILRLLVEGGERCVCEFDEILDVSDSAISHALSRLVEEDLVDRRKDGRWRVYSGTERAERIVRAVTEVAAE